MGNVSKFGQVYLLNIKMLDAEKVKVVASESMKISGGEAELVDAVPIATRKVFGKAAPLMLGSKAAGVQAAAAGAQPPAAGIAGASAEKQTPAMKKWGHITFWTGVGCLAIGGVGLGLGKAAADDYKKGDISAWDKSRNWTGVGFAALGVGAALAITGVVLWTLSPSEPESGVAIVPAWNGGDAVISIAGRF
ncbi:hypothetical protein D6833_09665 [Candidatus Parcubacteria bacterium]|nr:MAG: hypothetical protein D6833_09665 [Candidatus Parcubacteria bacterium]